MFEALALFCFKSLNCSLGLGEGIIVHLTTNKLKYQPKRACVAHGWNNGRQVVEGFVFRKAQEARSDKSDFVSRLKLSGCSHGGQ